MSKLDKGKRRGIILDYKRGFTPKEIAKKLKIHPSLVYYYLNKFDIPRKTKYLTKKEIQEILKDYCNGLPLEKLMKKWKISMDLIYYYLNKFDISRRVHHYTDEEVRKMMNDYNNGLLLKDIGKRFNISPDSVYHILARRNFVFSREGNRKIKEDQLEDIEKLYKKGWSTQRIAERYGVTKSRIGYWLKKKGIKLKTPTEWNKSRRKKIKPQSGMTKDKALLLGLLLSDGTESNIANYVSFASTDNFLKNFSIELVKNIYGVKGERDDKYRRIVWHSENMKDDIHKYIPTIIHKPGKYTHVPSIIKDNTDFSKVFLKGYFSCDGAIILCIDKNGRLSRSISLLSENIYLFNDLCRMLKKSSIRFSTYQHIINICSKNGLIKFHKEVGFLPVCVKGKNWRGFRKDKLLELAILSFSKEFKKSFKNKEEGYGYLKNMYKELSTHKSSRIS